MADYVANEIYAKHLARGERGFYSNFAKDRQGVYERFLVRKLSELSMNRFKWVNMPDSVDTRFLELTLLHSGLAVFYLDPRYGQHMALQGSPNGAWNATNNPTSFQIFGNNFPTTSVHAKDCVPIWANVNRISEMDLIYIYAHRLATVDRTLDINATNSRRTKTIIADENSRLSLSNINRQIEAGEPAVAISTPIQGVITAVDFGVDPKSVEVLHIYRVRLWNECMMMLGIDGANQDKKERLVASEVDANAEQIELNEQAALYSRQIAADQINRKYGLGVSVEFVTQDAKMSALEGS